tara:strand:- start:1069 stop:2289 length:1221 start_codon:yes stop_codon:yes gene_type:complete
MNYLVYAGLLFFPLQFLSIDVATSSYDISVFIFIIIGFILLFYQFKININLVIILSIFTLLQVIIFIIVGEAPGKRFISGLIWIGCLLLLLVNGNKNLEQLDLKIIWNIIVSLIILTSIILWYEFFFIITPERFNTERLLRPRSTFGEPSYASLVFYSVSVACYASLMLSKQKRIFIISLFLLSFVSGILTLGMHIITFLVTLGIISLIWLSIKISIKRFFLFFLIAGSIILLLSFLMNFEHFYTRLNFIGIEGGNTNGSLLSWLRGFDQMKASILRSPIFGMGLGSTGYFPFDSIYGEILARHGLYELTLRDAYSLAFRFIIELGIFHFLILTIFMIYKLYSFRKYLIKFNDFNNVDYSNTVFLLTFAVSLFIGSMIKEPNYARSTIFIAVFLIAILPLNHKKDE